MDIQKPKIVFYTKRKFGEKMDASFDFIKENRKPLFKYIIYLLLPLCLVQALSLNTLMSGTLNATALGPNADPVAALGALGSMFFVSYGLVILCAWIGSSLMYSLIYALITVYNEREERLVGIHFKDIREMLFRNLKRSILLSLLLFLIVVIIMTFMVVLTSLLPWLLLLFIPLFIAVSMPLSLLMPTYLLGEENVWKSIKKAFRLGFATWGGIFAIIFVMGLIAGILQGVTTMPWYVATVVKYFFTLSDSSSTVGISPLYSFLLYLLAVVQSLGMYLSMTLTFVALAYQYAHAKEKVEDISIVDDIDKFEQL